MGLFDEIASSFGGFSTRRTAPLIESCSVLEPGRSYEFVFDDGTRLNVRTDGTDPRPITAAVLTALAVRNYGETYVRKMIRKCLNTVPEKKSQPVRKIEVKDGDEPSEGGPDVFAGLLDADDNRKRGCHRKTKSAILGLCDSSKPVPKFKAVPYSQCSSFAETDPEKTFKTKRFKDMTQDEKRAYWRWQKRKNA